VANALVGFGVPLTVTVGAEESADGCELDDELAMVNLGEVEYSTPCVELMNTRK